MPRLLRSCRWYLLWSRPLRPLRWRDTRVWALGRLSLWRLPAWRKDYATWQVSPRLVLTLTLALLLLLAAELVRVMVCSVAVAPVEADMTLVYVAGVLGMGALLGLLWALMRQAGLNEQELEQDWRAYVTPHPDPAPFATAEISEGRP